MIVVVEQSWVGHHPTYFYEIVKAAAEHAPVLALCPKPEDPNLKGLIEVGRNEVTLKRLDFDLGKIPFKRKVPALYNFELMSCVRRQMEAGGAPLNSYVIFCCLYSGAFPLFENVSNVLPYRWSALMIDTAICDEMGVRGSLARRSIDPTCIYRADNCQSVWILEHEKRKLVEGRLEIRLVDFPDFIDSGESSEDALYDEIPELEGVTTPLVGVFGSLSPLKSLLELVRAANLERDRKWGILAVGQLDEASFEASDLAEIQEFFSKDSLSIAYFKRVQSEGVYNSALKRCSILYMCYQNFYRSSNTLTKAAYFGVPVIVLDKGCVANRVERYGMGEIIGELSPRVLNAAIGELLEGFSIGRAKEMLQMHDLSLVSTIIGGEYEK